MAVFKNSRYKGSFIYSDSNNEEIVHLDLIQEPKFKASKEDLLLQFKEGDRLDIIAKRLYGHENLEWVIMQANPQYMTPFDIKAGDILHVPTPERVGAEIE